MSQRDLTTTFAENILKQFENDEPIDSKTKLHEELNNNSSSQRSLKSPTQALLQKHEIKSEPVVKIERLREYDDKTVFSHKMSAKEIYEAVK